MGVKLHIFIIIMSLNTVLKNTQEVVEVVEGVTLVGPQ